MPRIFLDPPGAEVPPWQPGASLALSEGAVRHVQVLRLQPGDALTVFDGRGGEWQAVVEHMGRREVGLRLQHFDAVERELPWPVTLAVGMPANDRMDALVEKATELGAARLVPLQCSRSVLRLDTDRAVRRVAHWQAVAVAASEQSGRTRVLQVAPVQSLAAWLAVVSHAAVAEQPASDARWLLSPRANAGWPLERETSATGVTSVTGFSRITVLSGPEGGLDAAEEAMAQHAGFRAVSLGARILRADTAPLALLAAVALAGWP